MFRLYAEIKREDIDYEILKLHKSVQTLIYINDKIIRYIETRPDSASYKETIKQINDITKDLVLIIKLIENHTEIPLILNIFSINKLVLKIENNLRRQISLQTNKMLKQKLENILLFFLEFVKERFKYKTSKSMYK